MFAIAAVVVFAVALIVHLIASDPNLVESLVIGGFIALALHLAGLWPGVPWRGGPPPPA